MIHIIIGLLAVIMFYFISTWAYVRFANSDPIPGAIPITVWESIREDWDPIPHPVLIFCCVVVFCGAAIFSFITGAIMSHRTTQVTMAKNCIAPNIIVQYGMRKTCVDSAEYDRAVELQAQAELMFQAARR